MIKHLLTALFFITVIGMTNGQDWIKMQHEGSTFDEIKVAMNKKFNGKNTLKKSNNYSSEYKKYARWEYFWRYQLDASGNFVRPRQVLASWEESLNLNKNNQKKLTTSNWSLIGPDVIPTATAAAYAGMGRLNTVAFHPTLPNTIWVGAANGGLWKTTDGGLTWASSGGDLPVLGVSDIAVSSTGNIIYIASGDADGAHSTSVGILKSTDGGANFVATGFVNTATSNATAAFQIHHLWVDPSDADIVVATTTSDIQRSINGGTTWTQVEQNPASDLKQDPNDSNTLYAGSIDGIIKSTDGGATWGAVLNTLADAQKIDIALTAANSMVIYMISDNGLGAKSTDGGTSWSAMTMPQGYDTQGGYNMAIVVAPNNADKVMLAGVSGWVSIDGGTNWTKHLNGLWEMAGDEGKYIHSDHHMLKYLPGSNDIIFTAHDGGLHKGIFHDLNATWTDLSQGLVITQFYGMDGFPGDQNILIGGSQDNDGTFYNGTTWKNINNNSDGTGGRINYSNSAISYCKSQSGFLNRTIDSWANFTAVSPSPVDGNDKADFVWPLEMDPLVPTTIFAGYGNIYKSTDQGDNWTNLTNEADVTKPYTWISVAPSNTMTIYAIRQSSEIKRSTDGGMTWTTLTPPNMGTAKITSIEASLTDHTKVYLTYGNYDAGAKVYVSTNSGNSWTNISTGIPNIPIFTIAEKATSGDLYIGTQLGVYELTGGAGTWSAFNTNLPAVAVRELDINEGSSVLRAASFGRGIWKSSLGAGGCPSVATHTWTGATNTSWHESTNWSTGCVPAATNVVVIPDVTNDPIIAGGLTGNASTLNIQAGGFLTILTTGTLITSTSNILIDPLGKLTVDTGGLVNIP